MRPKVSSHLQVLQLQLQPIYPENPKPQNGKGMQTGDPPMEDSSRAGLNKQQLISQSIKQFSHPTRKTSP